MNLRRLRSVGGIVLANIAITLCLLELGLRLQQRMGPLYDLEFHSDAVVWGLSDELNHGHPQGTGWDSDGIRRMTVANAPSCRPKLLFMGDSFMEGLGPEDTIPVHVKAFFETSAGLEVCVFNAGASSYSPSIFVPQAKKLIPKIEPDLVLVDVDETDLFDDYYRYRELTMRDEHGSITAVRATPFAYFFRDGIVAALSQPLYVHRLLQKLYFTRFVYPRALALLMQRQPRDLADLAALPPDEERARYAAALAYFESTLEDLTSTILVRVGDPNRLIYLHHPHLGHLVDRGQRFNNVVAETVRHVAARHGVKFYDATDDLKAAFGDKPEKYYIPHDMHLNELGLHAYGLAVAKYLAPVILH
jgi:hypothetical protein